MEANVKQYGKYDGGFFKDPNFISQCTEQELYHIINMIGGMIWRANHDAADGRITGNFDLSKEQYAIEYCVMQTTRFGVEIPEPKEGEHVERTASYNAWFKWWNEYFQHTLRQEDFDAYNKKASAGEDVSKYRPAGDWRDNI